MKIIITAMLAAAMPLAVWAAVPANVQVPVLKEAIQKGQLITADDIALKDVSASQVFASTITESAQLENMQATRSLPADEPVNRLHVKVAPAIERGAAVTLRFAKGGIELTSKGQALEEGKLGQSIRVLNPATRATLVGVVQPQGVVQVN